MPERAEPPNIRDWSTLPWRVRLGFVVEVITFVSVGLLLGVGVVTFASAAILLAASLIAFVMVFDSRLPWWPAESTVFYDPLATNGGHWIVFAVLVIVITMALKAVGALH